MANKSGPFLLARTLTSTTAEKRDRMQNRLFRFPIPDSPPSNGKHRKSGVCRLARMALLPYELA
ncbi:hypothetical protein [Xanthomonas fragariae]|uniref:hypothetical protein n=1 Tax=Xanthomonas fragariae TaxID=48664 RepID=UPI00131F2719|nr:hypothetical protein [Xanthomonas fragariae]